MIALFLRAAAVISARRDRQSRRSTVAAAARVSLSRLGAFLLRLLGGNDHHAFAGFGEFDGRILFAQLPHGEVERVADVDGERTVLTLHLRPDELGLLHRNSLLTFSVGAGAPELGRPTRVATVESGAPAGGSIGRPLGPKASAVPDFTHRRIELGFSTDSIAAQLTARRIVTSGAAVRSWEAGSYGPSEHRLDALAEILFADRVTVERWFGVEIVGTHSKGEQE